MLSDTHGSDAETPEGWQVIVLRGGPFARQRFTIHQSDDCFELLGDDGRPHKYYRTNDRPEFVHESIIGSAFVGKGGAA